MTVFARKVDYGDEETSPGAGLFYAANFAEVKCGELAKRLSRSSSYSVSFRILDDCRGVVGTAVYRDELGKHVLVTRVSNGVSDAAERLHGMLRGE
jgi:hypothetical protein